MLEFKKYDHTAYTYPLWAGDTVYNETLMFVGEKEAPLLYTPKKIISVRSYDLKTEYTEGKDYILKNGNICLTASTQIPSFSLEEYYPDTPIEGHCFSSTVEGHPYIFYGEGVTFFSRQIHITYTHEDKWIDYIPPTSNKFKKFINKLSRGEEVTVLVYGDSISTGVCSSGTVGSEPYAENWCEMVISSLKKQFNTDKINYVNTAVGGMTTRWGFDNVNERAINKHPDLLLLGFGMNDAGMDPTEYTQLTRATVDVVLEQCPDCCIGVISTMLPHFRLAGFYGNQIMHEPYLYEMAKKYENVDVVPVSSMHQAVLKHKRYYDMTGNNVNHPNDFLARIYAQTVIKTILG